MLDITPFYEVTPIGRITHLALDRIIGEGRDQTGLAVFPWSGTDHSVLNFRDSVKERGPAKATPALGDWDGL